MAGKKRPPVTDWATERVVAPAVITERVRLMKVASAELQATIRAERPAWRTRLLADAHARARAATHAVRPAVDRLTGARRRPSTRRFMATTPCRRARCRLMCVSG